MKICSVEFGEYPVFAAPMEDVSEASFRYMCKKFGADLLYTEFAAANVFRSVNQTMRNSKATNTTAICCSKFLANSGNHGTSSKNCKNQNLSLNLLISILVVCEENCGQSAGAGLLQKHSAHD